jgi:hypothetical protein
MSTDTVSIVIPSETLSQVLDLQNQIKALMAPYLKALTAAERRELPKMADKTFPFVSKALDYAESNPEFAPKYLNVEALQIDVQAVTDLTSVEQPALNFSTQLNDTIMLCGSEAYVAALMYYNSVKEAARRNIPGAKAIFDDLKSRFEQSRKNEVAKAA